MIWILLESQTGTFTHNALLCCADLAVNMATGGILMAVKYANVQVSINELF